MNSRAWPSTATLCLWLLLVATGLGILFATERVVAQQPLRVDRALLDKYLFKPGSDADPNAGRLYRVQSALVLDFYAATGKKFLKKLVKQNNRSAGRTPSPDPPRQRFFGSSAMSKKSLLTPTAKSIRPGEPFKSAGGKR